jgi:hypothetical protein
MLIENHVEGQAGKIENPKVISTELTEQLKLTLSKSNIRVNANFYEVFLAEVYNKLELLIQKNVSITQEAVIRSAQSAFINAETKTKTIISPADKDNIAKDLREKISVAGIVKGSVASDIIANIKTADVKDKASSTNVVRLKITLKEEGLEWATRASESGGVVRTLQTE